MRLASVLATALLSGCAFASLEAETPDPSPEPVTDSGAREEANAHRYAVLIDMESTSGCSRGSGTSRSRSSMVLELRDTGRASACLGRRSTYSQHTVDGSSYYDSSEQGGYVGEWSRAESELTVDLRPIDEAWCPRQHTAESSDGLIYPPEIHPLRLRCREASPAESPPLPAGALLCQRSEARSDLPTELYVHGVLDDGAWIFLGAENGLHVSRSTDDAWGRGNGNHLDVRTAAELVGRNAWTGASE